MKNIVISISIILLAFNLNAQSIKELDKRAGFKELKLGKNVFSYKVKKVANNNYQYLGSCCELFFGAEVDNILLVTDKQQNIDLIRIEISFKDEKKYKHSYFDSPLTNLFGKCSFVDFEKENGQVTGNSTIMWSGEKVSLFWMANIQSYELGWTHTIDIVFNSFINHKSDW